MPLLFCVPVALITAELAGMHPVSGGQAAFVERAFGAGVGLQNACWVLLVVLADASIYPRGYVMLFGGNVDREATSSIGEGKGFAFVREGARIGSSYLLRTQVLSAALYAPLSGLVQAIPGLLPPKLRISI